MLSGIIVGALAFLFLIGGFMLVLRGPRCPRCRTPLESVEETTRTLGLYGVETVVDYACADCDWIGQRRYICTHVA